MTTTTHPRPEPATGVFRDLAEAPPEVQQQAARPTSPTTPSGHLPHPPICWSGGRKWTLERVRIDDLDAWRRRHGLRHLYNSHLGKYGPASFYWLADAPPDTPEERP